MDFESIKRLAKQNKCSIEELIALSPQNDPFYKGTKGDIKKAEWFYGLWNAFGYTTGVHIRRMHYAIVSQNPPVIKPDGNPYENTVPCWEYLVETSKCARYLGYVDPDDFVDRRNDEPVDHVKWWSTQSAYAYVPSIGSFEDIGLPELPSVPRYNLPSFESPQRYHLEIWCEKSTMNDILEPLVRNYGAALLYGKGELSITAALHAVKRFKRSGRPVRIFYVSDFDPAGADMPISMARKLEYFVHKLGLELDIKLYPVVLTYQQTQEYTCLLTTPIKESEKRKASFEAKYGKGAIELDALEALYPGELRTILVRELDRYYDHTLNKRLDTFHQSVREMLDPIEAEILERHEHEIETLENHAIRKNVADQIEQHMARRLESWHTIRKELEDKQPEFPEDDIPKSVLAEERDGALFDTVRDYLTQNNIYQAHRSNTTYDKTE